MFGLASIQGRKGLSKSPRLPTFAQHSLKASQSTSRSVVMTTDREGCGVVSLVACESRLLFNLLPNFHQPLHG